MKYQMHCPNCNHEFAYDNGGLDKNISRLGIEIQDIIRQLAEHNLLPKPERRMRTDWWKRAKIALAEKQKELAELKAFRKSCDQQANHYEYQMFKEITKEMFGEDVYRKILDRVLKEIEAYKISGLMRHEYTRSASKSDVISIDKI